MSHVPGGKAVAAFPGQAQRLRLVRAKAPATAGAVDQRTDRGRAQGSDQGTVVEVDAGAEPPPVSESEPIELVDVESVTVASSSEQFFLTHAL